MMWFVIAPSVVLTASMLVPTRADACAARAPGIHQVSPGEEPLALPANGVLFVEHYPAPVEGFMNRSGPASDNELIIEPLGSWSMARLQPAVVQGNRIESVQVYFIHAAETASVSRNLAITLSQDNQAPSAIQNVDWSMDYYEEMNSCGDRGYLLRGTYLQTSSDPEGPIGGYALVEAGGLESPWVLDFMLPSDVDGPLSFSAWIGTEQGHVDGRCFAVVAIDRAGNFSGSSPNEHCISMSNPDAGVPDAFVGDLSSLDGGIGSHDASTMLDGGGAADATAEARAGLSEPDLGEGCRCASGAKRTPSSLILLGLIALGLLVRRGAAPKEL